MPLHALVQPSAWHSEPVEWECWLIHKCVSNKGLHTTSKYRALAQNLLEFFSSSVLGICGLCHACLLKGQSGMLKSTRNGLCIMTENLNLNPETNCLYAITVLKLWFQSLEILNSWFSQCSFIFSLSQVGSCAFWIRHCSRRARRALRAHCHWYFDHWKGWGSNSHNTSATFGTCSHREDDIHSTEHQSWLAAYRRKIVTVYTFFLRVRFVKCNKHWALSSSAGAATMDTL